MLEDCAEAFSGFEYTGHPQSDISFVSFGSIKVATAFGAGVSRVRDSAVFARMKQIHSGYVSQTRTAWFTKVLKVTPIVAILNVAALSGAVQGSCFTLGFDHKALVVKLLRGFPDNLMQRLRARPSASLLGMLNRRLQHFDAASFQRNTDKGHVSCC
jgi:perosamine synthetase